MRHLALPLVLVLSLPTVAAPKFVARESDFKCLLEGTKVPGKNFYVFHRNPRLLRKALRIAERDLPRRRYPVGTILQFFPFEAMAKHGGGFNPKGHGWEFFQLDVSKEGTRIAARGNEKVRNAFGSCQGCHAAAKRYDFVCEGHGAAPLNLPDSLIQLLQTDPRCASQP